MRSSAFVVKQASKFVAPDLWDWSMWIEAQADAALTDVRWVMYGLHPSFPNPNRVIRNQAGEFRLSMHAAVEQEATWGTFTVRVTIVLRTGQREVHEVPLNLHRPDGSMPSRLLPVPEQADYALCKTYYRRLKQKSAFGYAREVLARAESLLPDTAASKSERIWIAQQKVLCTYKDSSLPADARLRQALELLQSPPCLLDLASCVDSETLGLGGAIYRRLWEIDRSHEHLQLALAYYKRGYECMLQSSPDTSGFDAGAFAGVNAAYLYDVFAIGTNSYIDALQREQALQRATAIRQQLARDLPALQKVRADEWWLAATLLEVLFGLAVRDPNFVQPLLAQAALVARYKPSPWERQSSGTQLLRSADLNKRLWPESALSIQTLLQQVMAAAFPDIEVADGALNGKLGLALSGGGFRASLYHIGVLARLAELDFLRHVEVLSCVSGGSIVGVHYYLLLRKLLQEKPDTEIAQQDYVDLVAMLLDQFLSGVQQNIRARVAASAIGNARMILQPSAYSRTQRLGELYEQYLYKHIDDGEQSGPRWLNEAFIVPKKRGDGWEDSFSPKLDNWARANKVPTLVLNATSLNTGRNWQFTASWMGEPYSYGTGVDATERLEPAYYTEAPPSLRQVRLGHAVAASSCVPVLFTPIVINGLYPDRTVRLVDGGVHDNQGTGALLDHDCDLLIVSDASGQMSSERNPPHSELGVMNRSNAVLQARVRVVEHQELQARERAGFMRQVAYLHLRKQIESQPVSPVDAEKGDVRTDKRGALPPGCTEYGIDTRLQAALAELRTDLDSFTDLEAFALMYSGYAMATRYVQPPMVHSKPFSFQWRFLAVRELMQGQGNGRFSSATVLRQLQVGSRIAFKLWRMNAALDAVRYAVAAAVAIALVAGLYKLKSHAAVSLNVSGIATIAFVCVAVGAVATGWPLLQRFSGTTRRAMQPSSFVSQVLVGFLLLLTSWLFKLHVITFDRLFLRLGRIATRDK